MDSDSCFGRLLDSQRGGYCSITPVAEADASRRYENRSLVLKTTFSNQLGQLDILDFFHHIDDKNENAAGESELIRLIVGVSGSMQLNINVLPRFDYGETVPQIVRRAKNSHIAFGSNKALLIASNIEFDEPNRHELSASVCVKAGEQLFLSLRSISPQNIATDTALPNNESVRHALDTTIETWRRWLDPVCEAYRDDAEILHSAMILKALTYSPSGAIIGAATTSLPEAIGGTRNWDYRFCWIRDSVYAADILFKLRMQDAANHLRAFIERSSAGSADQLQTLYAIDGKRRLTEIEINYLEGYRNSAPVRIGNDASTQLQWDMYGELLQLASLWYQEENHPEPDYWEFLVDVLNHVCKNWQRPDRGIWEFRDRDRHLVHSKACCWSALDIGIHLAQKFHHSAPLDHWQKTRDAIRDAIDKYGFDRKRGVFRQAFDSDELDAAVLRLPRLGFIRADDQRMMSSVQVIRNELDTNGLIRRYASDDGLDAVEGMFLPCTFWLATCLALQGKSDDALTYYRNAARCANDLGLFSEEYDIKNQAMLGNFPQALTHSSQIVAKMALLEANAHRGHIY
jgi:GH15 family glucan-1,4-alpha-glucosidase